MRNFGAHLLETVDQYDFLAGAWAESAVTVFAHVTASAQEEDDRGGTPVQATGALTLRVRDWLGPWLEVYQQVIAGEGALTRELEKVGGRPDGDRLLGSVFRRVRAFAALEPGVAGARVGDRAAEQSIRSFLNEGFRDVPKERLRTLVPALTDASRTVSTSGTAVLGNLGETRTDLTKKIEQSGGIGREDFGRLTDRLDLFDRTLSTKADTDRVTTLETSLTERFQGKADTGTLDELRQTLTRDVAAALEASRGVEQRITGLTEQVGGLSGRFTELNERVSGLDRRFVGIDDRFMGIDRQFESLNGSIDQRFSGLNQRVGTLSERFTNLDRNVDTINTDVTRLRDRVGRGPLGPNG
jgi:hypothetical protein